MEYGMCSLDWPPVSYDIQHFNKCAHIVALGLQEATMLFVGVAKLIQDKDVSGVFMASVCKIFTSDIRVRCGCTPCNQEARHTAEDIIMVLYVRFGGLADGYTDAEIVSHKLVCELVLCRRMTLPDAMVHPLEVVAGS